MNLATWEPTIAPRTAAQLFWVALVVVLFISANVPEEISENRWSLLVAALMLRIFMGVWVFVDAKAHQFSSQRSGNYGGFSILLGEIVVAVYLVKSRGWKGAGKTFLRILGYLAVVILSSALIQTAISFTGRKFGV